ncbi:MAG: amino acid adenylation domain-containing protein [Nostoc sp.]|uniref:amino acid adenylation domain-containing protein n=1 Tax=Nostoc sp. TaxID=1180 RepID=UPI002FF86FA0
MHNYLQYSVLTSESVPDKYLTLHGLFEAQVEKTPEAIALVLNSEQLTYRELNERANQLAHYLRSLNVAPEMLVGICINRSIEMIVGMLGILKAGGAFVPLDSSVPQERLAFILADTKVSVFVTLKKLLASIPLPQCHLVFLDADFENIAAKNNHNPTHVAESNNLAYTIYTSGSTGQPKGVMVNHQAICQGFLWMQETFPITQSDRILQKLPLTFDFSFWELFWPLMTGACVVLAKPGGEKDIPYLVNLIAQQKISILVFVPCVLQVFLSTEDIQNCKNIRMVFTGGEPLTSALKYRFFNLLPNSQLYDLFGSTENIIVTYWLCQPEENLSSFPLGHPFPNLPIYVVDEHLQPVPPGEKGELLVGGWGLARGYLNRPELTAEKFISNPFKENSQERLYRTGDIVRYLSDGIIEIFSRIDHQVKIRGFRIELLEIEDKLTQHPDVKQVVVIAREDVAGDKRLVAYVVLNSRQELESKSITELRYFLKQQLPDYMIPSHFVVLESLPLNSNGKVDRKALPQPEIRSLDLFNFVAPRTSIEEMLADIWAKTLGVDEVGIYDNFFELGGHSLLAAQIINQVRVSLGVELPFARLLEFPTVAGLAKVVGEALQKEQPAQGISLQPISRNQTIPLSFSQEQLWFLAQLSPDTPVYNEPCTIYLKGAIDVDSLEKALNEIIKRHESLRSRFIEIDGQPVMVIDPPFTFNLAVVDLKDIPEDQRDAEALRLAKIEAQQPFYLTCGHLLRATLMQLACEDYKLFLTFHHIIIDGVSLSNILLPELAALYQAFSTKQPSPLAELPIQYADFAVWQRQWLTQEILKSQLDFWKQQLADLPVLQLPLDRPRSTKQTFQGATQYFTLSKDLTQALKTLSQQEGVTLYMTLLAAFKTLLYRYTGQDDIVVGTVSARRNQSEIERLIGYFLNTLVLRTDLSGSPSFRQMLERVRSVTLKAYAHEDLPYQKLVETLQPERNLSQNPLFQVAFVLDPPVPSLNVDWTMSLLDIQTDTAKFDLTLEIHSRPEGIIGRLEHNTDLFDASTISRMIGHLQTILSGIVANPQQPISELPLLTEQERHQLLAEWNCNTTEYPQNKCIHQLFEAQVEQNPEAIAVVFENQQLTYRELNCRANQLAHHLQSLGVKPEILVGICVERSLEMVIGMLGILKAGSAYVPLDPTYPGERLAFMLENAQAQVLLTQQQLIESLPLHQASSICLDTDWEVIAQQSEENPASFVTPDNLAYVIYTSGSTGKPKGVAMSHRSLSNLIHWQVENSTLSREARTLLFSPVSFDVSFQEIFSTWCSGGTLVLISDEARRDPLQLWRFLTFEAIARIFLPFVALQQLAEVADTQETFPISLHEVITAGEQLLISRQITNLFTKLENCTLQNQYGPSESHVVTAFTLTNSPSYWSAFPPIGRPITNTQIYILDPHLQPVPIGVPGELYISGVGLARGYFNRSSLTDERFIPNPFSNKPGERLYKTGDKARYLTDGNIEFIGRIDEQVKIRGFRIELGEIEAVLAQHPDVIQTVVVVREDIPDNKRLVAYVVSNLIPERLPYISECQLELDVDGNLAKLHTEDISSGGVGLVGVPAIASGQVVRLHLMLPGENEARWLSGTVAWSHSQQARIKFQLTPTEQALIEQSFEYFMETQGLWKALQRTISRNLRDYLKQKLPDYMVPSAFVLMKALPLTPSGKLDRRRLRAPDSSLREVEDKFVAPSTPTEEVVAAIWIEVLGLQQVGINDNFFELGGHSLLATQIISRLREAFSIELPLRHIFETPKIASLSKAIETARSAESQAQSDSGIEFVTLPPLVPVGRHTYIPLSFTQQDIWIAQHFYANTCAYNIPITLRFTGALSKEVLEYSINEIIRRHEILRTTFTIKEGQPVQIIAPCLTLPLKIVDLQHRPQQEREALVQELANLEAQHYFDLASGPLIKTTLLQLATSEHWLLITMHHMITDGWSIGIFLHELETLYGTFLNGILSSKDATALTPLPELPVQYADFTLWQRKWLNEEVLQKQLSYWQKKLADFPTTLDLLLTEKPQLSTNSRRTSFYSIVLPETQVASIKALSRSQGVTIFIIILTALKILLFKWSGQTDIIVEATTTNRNTFLIEQMLGCFSKDVYLRCKVDGSLTGLLLLEQVKQTVSEAINNQEIPIKKVGEEILSEVKYLSTVNIIMAPPVRRHGQILEYEHVELLLEGELWDEVTPLALYIASPDEDCKTIEIKGIYITDLFDKKTIERLFSYYQEILQKLVHQPETKLSEFECEAGQLI